MSSAENNAVFLKQAQALHKAGFPQDDALFYWHQQMSGEWELFTRQELDQALVLRRVHVYYAAPMAEEILRRLPERLELDEVFTTCKCGKEKIRTSFSTHLLDLRKSEACGEWLVRYVRGDDVWKWFRADTLANAASAMFCHLAEQGLLPTPAK